MSPPARRSHVAFLCICRIPVLTPHVLKSMEFNVWYATSTPTGFGDTSVKFSKRFLRCPRSSNYSGHGHRQRIPISPTATATSPAVLGATCANFRHASYVAGVRSQCLRVRWPQETLGL